MQPSATEPATNKISATSATNKISATSPRMWKFELQLMWLHNLSSLMLLSILCRKAIAAIDWCSIGPTVEDNIIREVLQGVYVLAIHANY